MTAYPEHAQVLVEKFDLTPIAGAEAQLTGPPVGSVHFARVASSTSTL